MFCCYFLRVYGFTISLLMHCFTGLVNKSGVPSHYERPLSRGGSSWKNIGGHGPRDKGEERGLGGEGPSKIF